MAAALTLRVPTGVPLTNAQVDNNFSQLNTWGNTINSNVGVLSNLTTSATGNIVVAINEINAAVTAIAIALGSQETKWQIHSPENYLVV